MKVLVYGQRVKDKDLPYIKDLIKVLNDFDIGKAYFKEFMEAGKDKLTFVKSDTIIDTTEELKSYNPDFVLALGGDGTILSAMTLVLDSGIPILGINLGRLGFLSSVEKTKIRSAIQMLIDKKYVIDERTLIQSHCNLPIFEGKQFALNDFTLHKRDTSSMITVHCYIDGEFLNSYWADGVIVSTPTGSTGYSLSCGGPIIFPNSENFIITPVAPHNLNVRPIVLSEDSEIRFEIEGRSDNFLATLDSRYETITSEHVITIKKADFRVNLVDLNTISFNTTIHKKLMWGLDSRNQSI